MAAHSPRLWWLAVALLLWTPHSHSREITHEDIRDAMLSIVQMVRMSEDKIERHEYRERALGEQLKKMLLNIEKRLRALEPFNGMISRLDSRLSNVETILLQKEERERKSDQALEAIQMSLQALTVTVESLKPTKVTTEIDNNLTTADDTLDRRLDSTNAKIENVKNQIDMLKNTFNADTLRSVCLEVATEMNPFERHMNETEKLLSKYELKLNEYNGTTSMQVPTDIVKLNEVALADEAWHSKMTEEMEKQGKEITKVQKLLSDAESMWKELPKLSDIRNATNQTLEAIVNSTETLRENGDKSVDKVGKKLREMSDRLLATNEDIQQSLTQGNTLSERAFGEITISYEALRKEVQALTKNELVMLQMSDQVIATKKRLEYGVHEIVIKVKDLMSKYMISMNTTFGDRLNLIEARVVDNQALTHGNLSSKIETEMTQVWRQIGIMHEQLRGSKDSLDKLSEETETYVNSSTKTMGKLKKDVSDISERMASLSDNINYALGRLGLAMQEFNQISSSVATALATLKKESHVTHNVTDAGPGPHIIPSEETIP